ncbi:MAG: hypothetical protein HZA50_16420 [Planctomycetes bacterium]|nr:hypothetical protein [Planctomycetota bacterium]
MGLKHGYAESARDSEPGATISQLSASGFAPPSPRLRSATPDKALHLRVPPELAIYENVPEYRLLIPALPDGYTSGFLYSEKDKIAEEILRKIAKENRGKYLYINPEKED